MEYDTKIVRKKFEELMENPLAKELWVTDPDNFTDPSYYPYLDLIIDSDDITDINVEKFEEMYSDEDSNLWNGVIKNTLKEFDPIETGVRRLTCVYKDNHWLSFNEQLVTARVKGKVKVVPRRILKNPYY